MPFTATPASRLLPKRREQPAPIMSRAALHRGPHRLPKLEWQLEQLGHTANKMGADLRSDLPTPAAYSNPLHNVGSVLDLARAAGHPR